MDASVSTNSATGNMMCLCKRYTPSGSKRKIVMKIENTC